MLGENYCRIYSIIRYPSECDYGWLAKLTNIPGTIVSINYEPLDNSTLIGTMSKNISLNRGQELSTKDPLERQRCKKAADDAEKIMRQMDQLGEVIGAWNTVIMVLSRDKEDFQNRCTRVESIANTLGCKVRILSKPPIPREYLCGRFSFCFRQLQRRQRLLYRKGQRRRYYNA